MRLGAFSISLAVQDLRVSRDFYEKLGFEVYGGEESHHYLIMKNEGTIIGLFEGMFKNNLLTFNPGWDQDANSIDSFSDVREVLENLKSQGINIASESISEEQGSASFSIVDPDGNSILIDQHV